MRMYSDRTRFFQSLMVGGPVCDCDASLPWSLIDDATDTGAQGDDIVPAPLLLPDAPAADALSPLRVVRSISIFSVAALHKNTKNCSLYFHHNTLI